MLELIVKSILILVACYLCCGVIFSFFFITRGIKIIDPDGAHDSTTGFKIIIIPGVIVFWILLLTKWKNKMQKNKDELGNSLHRMNIK